MNISSTQKDIQAADSKIYNILCDFQKVEKFLPPQVQNWKIEGDTCQFDIQGIASVKMTIVEKQEFSHLAYRMDNDKNMPLSFAFDIKGHGTSSDLTLNVNLDVPVFLAPMVKGPVQKVADTIVEKIKMAVEQA
ncbi:MAG: hypothetical protein MJZ70_05665 [Bacteroidales bacterium]|nr:hypothetical protein [Bacteroidales bacterium]